MNGIMMGTPLLISSILRHVDRNFPEREIVSVMSDGSLHRYDYKDCFRRARKLANALEGLGLARGDRVATLAWNDYRHLEAYYGVGGAGFVCHTINPRLFAEQIVYVINHAEDRWVMTDPMFVPLLERLSPQIPGVEGYIVTVSAEDMPETTLDNAVSYEALIADAADTYEWPELDENTAVSLCYTSGTTGNPKGVLYSHRSTVLHAYAGVAPDAANLSSKDCVLPAVPLFHVNAWGIPYSAVSVGAKLVLPGPKMGDGKTLVELMEKEHVSMALGVPTIWLGLLQYAEQAGIRLDSLQRTLVGGAAVPESMIRSFAEDHGVVVQQGWGMTEMSPMGTVNTLKGGMPAMSDDELIEFRTKAGRCIFGVEMRIVDDEGTELPWDGDAFGALQVRGPWVCSGYFKLDDASAHTDDGWFDTGDVATIDAEGFLQITDRTKDVIKSGGEWISSIEIENLAVGHPAVAEAAVIAIAHPKWTERPLLVAVVKEGESVTKDGLREWLEGKIASWWMPDDVVFVDELPHTATGKVRKTALRQQFADYSPSA